MKGILIKDTVVNKISYYHMLLFLMVLPLDRLYSELILISLCLHTIIHYRHFTKKQVPVSGLLLLGSIYLLTLIGTIFTHFKDGAFFEWERQLAFLLFPLICYFNGLDFSAYRTRFLEGLGYSCLIIVIYLYGQVFSVIYQNHFPITTIFNPAFINHNFSAPLEMHATYFSIYIIMGLVGLFLRFWHAENFRNKIFYAIACLILVISIFQLSSKAMLLALAFIANLGVPLIIYEKSRRVRYLFLSISITLLAILGLTQVTNLKSRLIVGLKDDIMQSSIKNDLLEPRVKRWECAWDLIVQSPVYGHGAGSEVAKLKEVYFQRHLYNSYLHNLNAHNEYLSMWLKFGILGLLIFLLLLFVLGKAAYQRKDLGGLSFILIIAIVSFSENILDGNKGIFFSAYFFSIYYFSLLQRKEPAIQK